MEFANSIYVTPAMWNHFTYNNVNSVYILYINSVYILEVNKFDGKKCLTNFDEQGHTFWGVSRKKFWLKIL